MAKIIISSITVSSERVIVKATMGEEAMVVALDKSEATEEAITKMLQEKAKELVINKNIMENLKTLKDKEIDFDESTAILFKKH